MWFGPITCWFRFPWQPTRYFLSFLDRQSIPFLSVSLRDNSIRDAHVSSFESSSLLILRIIVLSFLPDSNGGRPFFFFTLYPPFVLNILLYIQKVNITGKNICKTALPSSMPPWTMTPLQTLHGLRSRPRALSQSVSSADPRRLLPAGSLRPSAGASEGDTRTSVRSCSRSGSCPPGKPQRPRWRPPARLQA